MIGLILLALYGQTVDASLSTWWHGFCERHLIADDPSQFEGYSADQLVGIYLSIDGDKSDIVREAKRRIEAGAISRDAEILKVIVNDQNR